MEIRLMLGVALVVGLPALGAQTTFSNNTAIALADAGPAVHIRRDHGVRLDRDCPGRHRDPQGHRAHLAR